MPARPSLFLLAALLIAACAPRQRSSPLPSADPGAHTSLAVIRAEIDKHTCAFWSPEAQQWDLGILSDRCGATRDPRIGDAIRIAVQRTTAILPLATAAYDHFYAEATSPGLTQATADDLARRSFWSDPLLNETILLQVGQALGKNHQRCDDCPVITPREPVEVASEQLLPFIFAYIWPVQSVSSGPIEIYVCAGMNGAAELPANERLRQAGFLVAASFADDHDAAAEILRLGGQHNAHKPPSIDGLAGEIHAFVRSPAGQKHSCRALADIEWFTGVRVRECP